MVLFVTAVFAIGLALCDCTWAAALMPTANTEKTLFSARQSKQKTNKYDYGSDSLQSSGGAGGRF